MTSGHANELCRAEGIEAVHQGDAGLDFCGLSARVSRGDAFAEGFEATHPGFDPSSGVVSGPPFPERPAIVARGAQGFVTGSCCRAVLFPGSTVLADWSDRGRLLVDDGGVASEHVIGAVGRDGADVFPFRDLVEQFRQDGTVAIAAGDKFHRPNVQSGPIHGQMHLAPLASALNAMFAGLPLAIAEVLRQGTTGEKQPSHPGQCPERPWTRFRPDPWRFPAKIGHLSRFAAGI